MSIANNISPVGIRALWNLDLAASRSCSACADMGLAEYGILASIYEHQQGMSARQLRGRADDERLTRHLEERLLDKELVVRMRDMADRRAIAYTVTNKGRKLVNKVDKAIALAFMGRFPNMGEADFELFVGKMHAFSAVRNCGMVSNLLFPSEAVRAFACLRRISTHETSHASMSLSQLVLLCILESEERSLDVREISRQLALGFEITEFLLDEIAERGIVFEDSDGSGYSISQSGIERSRVLRFRIGVSFGSVTARFDQGEKPALDELMRYAAYQFA